MKRPYALVAVGVVAVMLVGGGLAVAARQHPSTPHGAVDPRVTQANIGQTICVKGYTATVRPPTSYTGPIKLAQLAALPAGSDKKPADWELDHVVPLEVGGAPGDPANLRIQLWDGSDGAHSKDAVENTIHAKVCSGAMTLAAGQRCFLVDWRQCR